MNPTTTSTTTILAPTVIFLRARRPLDPRLFEESIESFDFESDSGKGNGERSIANQEEEWLLEEPVEVLVRLEGWTDPEERARMLAALGAFVRRTATGFPAGSTGSARVVRRLRRIVLECRTPGLDLSLARAILRTVAEGAGTDPLRSIEADWDVCQNSLAGVAEFLASEGTSLTALSLGFVGLGLPTDDDYQRLSFALAIHSRLRSLRLSDLFLLPSLAEWTSGLGSSGALLRLQELEILHEHPRRRRDQAVLFRLPPPTNGLVGLLRSPCAVSSLKRLSVRVWEELDRPTTTALGKALVRARSLESLELAWGDPWTGSGREKGRSGLSFLAEALKANKSLLSLRLVLRGNPDRIPPGFWEVVRQKNSLRRLELVLGCNEPFYQGILRDLLEGNPSLDQFSLQTAKHQPGTVGPVLAGLVAGLRRNTVLRELALEAHTEVGAAGLVALGHLLLDPGRRPPRLQRFSLAADMVVGRPTKSAFSKRHRRHAWISGLLRHPDCPLAYFSVLPSMAMASSAGALAMESAPLGDLFDPGLQRLREDLRANTSLEIVDLRHLLEPQRLRLSERLRCHHEARAVGFRNTIVRLVGVTPDALPLPHADLRGLVPDRPPQKNSEGERSYRVSIVYACLQRQPDSDLLDRLRAVAGDASTS